MRNIALKFFSLGCSSFSRNDVCKTGTPLVKTECFFLYTKCIDNEVNLLNIPEQKMHSKFGAFSIKFNFDENT